MNRRTLLSVCALALSVAFSGCIAVSQDAHLRTDFVLADHLDPILHKLDVQNSIIAARVIELPSGRELYASNPDRPVMPASNGKLSVSAAALDFFGPGYTFKTYLCRDGDDLWIIGTGDPAPGDSKIAALHHQTTVTLLEQWADTVKSAGLTHVKDIHYYDGAFESLQICPTWSRGYLTDWYACPVSGLNFNDNCIDTSLTPTTDGKPADYKITPPVTEVRIINHTITGGDRAELTPAQSPAIERERAADVFTLTGHVLKPTKLESKAVTNPGAFFADALRTQLIASGITVDGKILHADSPLGDSEVPPSDKILATHETRFQDILNRICRNSQNLFAECMDKALGKAYFTQKGQPGPGSWEKGNTAVHAFLRSYKIDDKPLYCADGSGLSRQNRVTARLITNLLAAMHRHRFADVFRNALAQPGKDGTLGKGRLEELQGHLWAKTGYIGGVRALSGYLQTKHGKLLAFSFIYNDIPGSVKPYESLQDQAVRYLYSHDRDIFNW